jgi:hypothetical protein
VRTLLLLALTAALLLLPSVAGGDHLRHEKSPWEHVPITVSDHPDLPVAQVVSDWNTTAGFQLLTLVPEDGQIEVRWSEHAHSYAAPNPWGGAHPVRCVAAVSHGHAHIADRVLAHEVGHCLGWADHVLASQHHSGARVCDDPSHPAFSPYAGIMSYCTLLLTGDDTTMIASTYQQQSDCPHPGFTDTPGHTHERAIRCAAAAGWITGYPDGTFRPNQPITRGQAAAILHRIHEGD